MPVKPVHKTHFENFVLARDSLGFNHSIFMQCYLPIRPLKKGQTMYKVRHGNCSLVVRAGCLVDPDKPHQWEECEVPAGSKARLLLAYINSQAIRTLSPHINLGDSMRQFMQAAGIPIGGRNGKELTRQVKNVAAAEIILGTWTDGGAVQQKTPIAEQFSFWFEKDPRQLTFWQPSMTLSPQYFQHLHAFRVPLDFRALVALQEAPRAMDIYLWLAYRLRSLKSPTKIPFTALHPVFGRGIQHLRNFKIHFRRCLKEALHCYPAAKVTCDKKDYITIHPSPAAVAENAPHHPFPELHRRQLFPANPLES